MNIGTNLNAWLVTSVFLLAMVGSVEAGTITVRADGTGDYPTIQDAINAANPEDSIELQPGTYTGDGNWDINFSGKTITVQSADPNDRQIVETTIIDCNDPNGGSHYGVTFYSGETAQTVLSGISIINSTGAISCGNDSSPTIRNCNFYGNNGSYAIACAAGSPNIDNCIIQGNKSGGGVLCGWQSTGPSSGFTSQPTIVGCSIYGNNGNGVEIIKGSPTVINTIIIANSRYGIEGQDFDFPPPDFLCTPLFTNCLIAGNLYGGVHLESLFGGEFDATLQNCTIVGNYYIGIHFHGYGTNIILRNSIVAYNCDYQGGYPQIYLEYMYGEAPSMTISYSNIPDGLASIQIDPGSRFFWEEGNLESEPNFVNVGYWSDPTPGQWGDETWFEGNYHLQWFSACMDAGDNNAVSADTTDLDNDENTSERIPLDLDGGPRFVDDPVAPDTGRADPPDYPYIVDMGAYEEPDSDGDGVPDAQDNCPAVNNPDQNDADLDGFGDICDSCPFDPNNDEDADQVCGDVDNCPYDYNPPQEDRNSDGLGDVCECDAANLDGLEAIDFCDFSVFADDWREDGTALAGDINGDEVVDFNDLEILAYHWLSDCPP
jgi:hypothetical protein